MKTATLLAVLTFAALTASASSVLCNPCLGGFEDTPTGDRDFNDITFTINGGSLIQSTGAFTILTPALALSNAGTPFWDNVSGDGLHMNIGDYWEGVGGYSGPVIPGTIEYLATSTGGMVSDVKFSGGATVTITGGITADNDTLDVCYVDSCAATTQAVSGSLTWTPTQDWEVIGVVNGSAKYFSDAQLGQSSSFAFAVDPVTAPEPSAIWMVVGGLALIMTARARRNPARQ